MNKSQQQTQIPIDEAVLKLYHMAHEIEDDQTAKAHFIAGNIIESIGRQGIATSISYQALEVILNQQLNKQTM